MNQDLIIIKKKYGEKMMQLCRSLFPILLEEPGLLSKLMLDNFEPSRYLYEDLIKYNSIKEFENYICSLSVKESKEEKITVEKTPFELLDEAGYILYECKTEQDIQKFRKYYEPTEELCTFRGDRIDRCYVFFAVKKNIKKIKRKQFLIPEREDEYGTSIISIQFTRGEINFLSIKNRYNHKVINPDATFGNNLDNIIPGLTESFVRTYYLNLEPKENDFELPGYVRARDGKLYKYNIEINNIYYCPGNIIIDNFRVINQYKDEPERYIVLDYFIIDLSYKMIELYDKSINDSFIHGIKKIEKITIIKDKNTGNKVIEIINKEKKKIKIIINKTNQIIEYYNESLEYIGNDFMFYNETLINIYLPQVTLIGNMFLRNNLLLERLNIPKLIIVGNCFLYSNKGLTNIVLPSLKIANYGFLSHNENLNYLYLPNLIKVGDKFLSFNEGLTNLYLPKLISIGDDFLPLAQDLLTIYLPNLTKVGNNFLIRSKKLTNIKLPKLVEIGQNFLLKNNSLTIIKVKNKKSQKKLLKKIRKC